MADSRDQKSPSVISQASSSNEELVEILDRNYSWPRCVFMVCGLSLCITVDILQYSMPLAFLPSVLEDRGHRPMVIATAIGVYYWTGFAGGVIITGYQISKLFQEQTGEEEVVTVQKTRHRIYYLIVGLLFGTVTLMAQAFHPHCNMHTACRFIQGLAGAFIFFYGFLLSVEMFHGSQQIFAMTAASTALNIAEVLGSTLGAFLYDRYGQEAVFCFLGVVSIINQLFLVSMLFMLTATDEGPKKLDSMASSATSTEEIQRAGWKKLKKMLRNPQLGVAVVLIVTAALVKASVEEILPFHADHRWGLGPLEIGRLFSIIAVAYIGAAMLVGRAWSTLARHQVCFSSTWLVLLGIVAWCVFLTAGYYKRQEALEMGLAMYGVCLGMTHTPAALLLADGIEQEEGRAKDSANGIWNTMWEAGGSIGFLLGGVLAEDYEHQVSLMAAYVVMCIGSSGIMVTIHNMARPHRHHGEAKMVKDAAMYGSMEGKKDVTA